MTRSYNNRVMLSPRTKPINWTEVNLPQQLDGHEPAEWCSNHTHDHWGYPDHGKFWFKSESDAIEFVLKWCK